MRKQLTGSERPMNRAGVIGPIGPLLGAAVLAFGCAGVKPQSTSGTAGSGNGTGLGGFGGSGMMPTPCMGVCTDFPATPDTRPGAPANAATIFGAAGSGSSGGPCIIEPQENSLFPNNWLRPRFRWTAGQGL